MQYICSVSLTIILEFKWECIHIDVLSDCYGQYSKSRNHAWTTFFKNKNECLIVAW